MHEKHLMHFLYLTLILKDSCLLERWTMDRNVQIPPGLEGISLADHFLFPLEAKTSVNSALTY